MPATVTTKSLKDAAGATFTQNVLDVSGVGSGPFQPLVVVANSAGTGIGLNSNGQAVMAQSAPVTIASDHSAVRTTTGQRIDAVFNDQTALVPKFAVISCSTLGNNTIVAAVTSKKIRVLGYNLMGNGAVNVKFQSGASGGDITGLKYIAGAGGGICAPYNPVGWFETTAGVLLNLNLSAAIAVGGELVYVEV